MRPEVRARVTVGAPLKPSEDPEKVLRALQNVLGEGGEFHIGKSEVRMDVGDLSALEKIHDQLRDRHVRAAGRRILLRSIDRGTATILLNKQAAVAGVVALCGNEEESPLGAIRIRISSPKIEEIVDWLTAYEGG
ncbi:MAG: hypothetical protein HY247_00265 [archaeon]|nr:MAG: hypothetical protein HY247_00265 [archaeon]